jgi:toxin ParE1/3/4|tara:strand:- start:2688 stop:2936 length:249 start_codon:yes stop_codon:yes gene_type:complete
MTPKKSRKVRVTPRARDDLKNIGRYTEQTWGKGQHVIFYLVGGNAIGIIGIPHKEMDIISYFKDSCPQKPKKPETGSSSHHQ